MITIKFRDDKTPLEIDAETIAEAVAKALSMRKDLRWADLRGADLRGADLRWADLRGADLSGADLSGADLSGADLSGANLRLADLSGANLSGANLSGANLRWADLSGANLRWADLDYSCWTLSCKTLTTKIDKRLFCQLLYHTLRAGQSVDDTEIKKLFAIPEVLALANQFHRVEECGKIKTDTEVNHE